MEESRAAAGAPAEARRLRRAGRAVRARHTGEPAALPRRETAQSARTRALAHRPQQSAGRAGRRQSHLADALRPRPGRDAGGLRQPGRLPTHPELLDWLAARFIDSGWDVKALHRLIVSSQAYRRASQAPADLIARDPDNLLLARGRRRGCSPRRFATAHSPRAGCWRAASAARASSRISPRVCGSRPAAARPTPRTAAPQLYRRSLYTFWKRTCRRRRWPHSTRCRARSAPRSATSPRRRCNHWCC